MMDAENNNAAVKTSVPKMPTNAIKNGKPSAAEMNALAQAFNQNLLAAAAPLAISITQRFPEHGWGWKVLGAIYQQQGLLELALKPLELAAELLPQDSEAQYNLANYFYDQLQLDAAVRYYKKAIKLAPKFTKSHYNLGSVFKDQGLFNDAAVHYKLALKIDPHNVAMNFNLALMLYEQADFTGAITYYQRGLKLQPDVAQANLNLGASFKALGDLEQAKYYYQEALSINPDYIDAYNNLGLVFKELGDAVEAEHCYRTAIAIDPNYAAAYNNLGLLFEDKGDVTEAESCYLKALQIDPLRAVSYNNLAAIYREQGRLAESEHCCRRSIEIKPDFATAYNNLGLVLGSMGHHAEAIAEFEQALEYEPNNITMLSNFAVTLNALSQLTRAEGVLKKALDIFPGFINAYVNLCLNYLSQGRISEAKATCIKALQIEPDNLRLRNSLLFAMNYSATSTVEECLQQAREFGRIAALKATTPYKSWQFDPAAKRLRVGLVSGDLRSHSVAYFLENLLQHIDPAVIELFAYSAANSEDDMTARLKQFFSGWKSLAGLSDQAAAQLIHDDGLHILIDLSGHSNNNRLPVFSWKPAPVQVSWLGYFATTGLEAMDYFIADEVGVPVANQSQFVEKVKYLADTRLCFTAPDADLAVSALPALTNGYITFGCFQNMAKVGDDVLDLWTEVMAKVPSSRLRWQCKPFRDDKLAAELRGKLVKRGIHTDRISLVGSTLRDAYLAAHAEVDFMLDTFPFNGGTTTCEALWMGVPTLTLSGNTLIARQGASLMSAAGLANWVVETKEEYINKALLLSNDLDQLSHLRAGLRDQVLVSALFDAASFAKNMQGLLWEMWHEHQGVKSMLASVAYTSAASVTAADLDSTLKIKIITATKHAEADFWSKAALGLSLKRHLKMDSRLSVEATFANARGLSELFNQAIARADEDDILVFMHDDVWIDEAKFADAVIAGLKHYDVIGIAGNRRRVANQPSWIFVDADFTWDDKSNLSGSVAHGQSAFSRPEYFGEVPAACELLDGVFIASKKYNLKQVQFDPQFDFHFYDMDFCRSARKAGLKLGTWLIKLTHQSAGAFDSPQWRAKYELYKNKWEQAAIKKCLISPHDALTERELNLQQVIIEVLEMALKHQSAGQLEQAKSLYLEILDIQPEHAEANHTLGVIEANSKGALMALPRFELAVQSKPDNEQYWVSYIDALMQAGHFDSAADALELGVQYGLKADTAIILAKGFAKDIELQKASSQNGVVNQQFFISPRADSQFKGEGSIKFVIVAPYYTTKSAGIVVLHELCDSLNKLGHTAAMVLTGSGKYAISNDASYYGPNLQWYSLKDINEANNFVRDGIVIYPEIVSGNPLGGKRVVRYLLNAEGAVAKNSMQASDDDFILAFATIHHKSPHAHLTKLPINPIFNNDNTVATLDRPIDLTYVGKGARYNQCFIIPNTLEINREWPRTRPELAMLFKNTRYYFTWDVLSQTTTDAFFCGAIPVLLSPLPLKSFDELGMYPMATCTIVGDDVIVNVPDDFDETLLHFKKMYMEQVDSYETRLLDVVHQMLQHFSNCANELGINQPIENA
jgi:predicted O-linked N-acetylglucosamine transferase (SPINDLY family)/glycosyltransferase involved in cell wall biosynthesis